MNRRDYGHHQIGNLYPAVVQIAAECVGLQQAMPGLTRLALANKAPRIELVQWYLDLRPEQHLECPRCHEFVRADLYATTMCQACACEQYYAEGP